VSHFDASWLLANSFSKPAEKPTDLVPKVLWTASQGKELRPSVPYERVMNSEEEVFEWVTAIVRFSLYLCNVSETTGRRSTDSASCQDALSLQKPRRSLLSVCEWVQRY
jgi:hypothetical protein